MSLWLYSSGDGEDNLDTDGQLLSVVGGRSSRLTFVPTQTVGVSEGEVEYYYSEFRDRFAMHGYKNVGMLALDRPMTTQELEKAVDSELLYLSGGNTFHFLDLLRRSGFGEVLKRRAESGLPLAGHSAGAIVLTPTIATASYPEDDRDEDDVGLTDLAALSLVGFEFFPHYEAKPNFDQALLKASQGLEYPVYGVPDGSAIMVDRGRITFFGAVSGFTRGVRFKVSR